MGRRPHLMRGEPTTTKKNKLSSPLPKKIAKNERKPIKKSVQRETLPSLLLFPLISLCFHSPFNNSLSCRLFVVNKLSESNCGVWKRSRPTTFFPVYHSDRTT